MGTAGGEVEVVMAMEVVGGAGGTGPKFGVPYGKGDGCGEEGPADDGPAAVAHGNGSVGTAPTARDGNCEKEGPLADVRTSTSARRDEN